jgi:hypothetical protein
MSPVREAFVLPLLFLTVILMAGLEMGATLAFTPPSAFSLILASFVVGILVRSAALGPDRLLHGQRTILANANGTIVLATLFAASAQLLTMLTPTSGLPLLLFDAFLLVLLFNTLVTAPDRVRGLRSLLIVFGSAFLLKFVVLASLSDPAGGRVRRVLLAIFDVATLGTVSQDPIPSSAAYLAFVAIVLYMIALTALPAGVAWMDRPDTTQLVPRETADMLEPQRRTE